MPLVRHLTTDFSWVFLSIKYLLILESVCCGRITEMYLYPLHITYTVKQYKAQGAEGQKQWALKILW